MFNSKINKNLYSDNITDIVIGVKDEFDKKINDVYKKVDSDLMNIFKTKEMYIEVSLEDKTNKSNLKNILSDYEYDNDIGYIGDIFLKLDYFERKEIEGRIFKVDIIINEIIYEAKVVLERDWRYIKEYENLIEISIKNNLIFTNFPKYIFERMYRVKIINLDERITLNDLFKMDDVIYNFEELTPKIVMDSKLVWNVSKVNVFPEFKVMPSETCIYYEYIFKLEDDYIYLVDEDEKDIYGLIRTKENLNIYSKELDKKIWKLYKVDKLRKETKYTNFNNFFEISDSFNTFNINRILKNFDILKDSFYVEKISKEKGEYINYIEEENNKEIVYITISIIKSEEIFDKINYFKEIIENKYFKYKVRVITNAN